ncbi:ATP-binding protein [Achromobacter insuavis]|uniref:ATP-binding protein n=1 Tax=Achromobacter insuavis TaxID=1287735 RepID=UPI0024029BB2|nr:AAA family ATPase [Achromobacter insuavis]
MRPTVVYLGIWLLSERDLRARRITFNPKLNLLTGGNETGKSRILKHIVWALGGEPTSRDAGNWDVNVIAALGVVVDSKRYTFLRRGLHERAVFDESGDLIRATESASVWADVFSSIFGYPLKLQRHSEGVFALAGPEYALLPFYIDQEGGWTNKWASFTRLTQFARWEPMVFGAFTGLRPLRYFDAQLARDSLSFQIREARAQVKVQERAFQQVKNMLPQSPTKIDENLFAHELKALSSKVILLGEDEAKIRAELLDVARQLQERSVELRIVSRAEHELVSDLAYLSKAPDEGSLTCPTCGQEHQVNFQARFELASSANDAHLLVIKVRDQLNKLKGKEVGLRAKLGRISSQIVEIRKDLEHREGDHSVSDVVTAKSLDTITIAYQKAQFELKESIDDLDEDYQDLKDELARLTDEERMRNVRKAYKDHFNSYASNLLIDRTEVKVAPIGSRPKLGSGSSGPRIVLATHMALLKVNEEFGNGPRFPFIVDTPRQQDLDKDNAQTLLRTIAKKAATHQLFIANGDVPEGWEPNEDCSIFAFDEKRKLLQSDVYADGVALLSPYVQAMEEAIRQERVNNLADSASTQSESQDSLASEANEPKVLDEDGAADDE